MKKQNRYGLILVAVWVLGVLAAFLRRALYIGAVDAKGLLISRHPLEMVLWAVVALGAAGILLTVRKLDGPNGYEENFGPTLPSGYILLALVIAWMILLNNFHAAGRLALVQKILGILLVPGLLWGGICRYRGKMPFFGIYAALYLFLLLYLVSCYQLWSGNPQLQDYVFELLALVALVLLSYQQAAFAAGMGSRRMQLATGLLAVLMCAAALGWTETTGLFAAGLIWAATDLCRLDPPPVKDEVDAHDPA